MTNDTAYEYDPGKVITFIDYPIIACNMCDFEPEYAAWDTRDRCGCFNLVTYLLERAQVLGSLIG